MVDFQKAFLNSWNILLKDKKIVIPYLMFIVTFILFGAILLQVTGIYPFFKEYKAHYDNYIEESYDLEKIKEGSPREDFTAYLENNGFSFEKILTDFNLGNLALIILIAVFGFIILFYLSIMTNQISASAIKEGKIDLAKVAVSSLKLFLRYFAFNVIGFLIFFLPALIIMILAGLLILANETAGILVFILLIILYIVYLVIFGIRFYFSLPAMFLENKTAFGSYKESHAITKGNFLKTLFIFGIFYSASYLIGKIGTEPLSAAVRDSFFGGEMLKILINTIFVGVFIAAAAYLLTLLNLFLFNTYIEFKKMPRKSIEIQKPANNFRYAGFWIRFAAEILDLLIIGLPALLISVLLIFFVRIEILYYLVFILVIILSIYLDGKFGGTPGKLILGLRIVNSEGKYIGIPTASLRYIGKILSYTIIGIGHLFIVWEPKKQALHDKVANSYVIRK